MNYVLENKYRPDCIVYFTDGYCTAPNPHPNPAKMLWIICSNGKKDYDIFPGKVVQMQKQ